MMTLTGFAETSSDFSIGGYKLNMHEIADSQEFYVGCVKNIPFKDMKVMYEYTKTL